MLMIMPSNERKIVTFIHLLWLDTFENGLDLGDELQHITLLNKKLLTQKFSKILLAEF